MINGKDHIFAEEGGQVKSWDYEFGSKEQLEDMIQQIIGRVSRMVNASSPIVGARMPDGSRVYMILLPITLGGPTMIMRELPQAFIMDNLVEVGALTKEATELPRKLVRTGHGIFISGGTNPDKTTFLNALSTYIPEDERIITIEDSAELQIQRMQDLVRMETRNANAEGEGVISIGDLIRASLHTSPDGIIADEVRGKEALEPPNAYSAGHDGELSSGCGSSPRDMLVRLEIMVLTGADLPPVVIRSQIAPALDIMIYLGQLRDKNRKVLWITEMGDYEEGEVRLNTLYRFEDTKEKETLKEIGKLKARGELWVAGDSL